MHHNHPVLLQELADLRQKLHASKLAFDSTVTAYKALLDAFNTFRDSFNIVQQLKCLKDLPMALESIRKVRSLPNLHLVLDQDLFSGRVSPKIPLVASERLQAQLTQFSPTIHAPRLYLGDVACVDNAGFFLGRDTMLHCGSCFIFALRHKYQQQKLIGLLAGQDQDSTRFTSEQATDFLEHFCDTLSCTLITLLEHAQLEELSARDSLTGVHNRSYLERHAQRILDFSSRKKLPVHLLFIDFNDFKKINDSLGHEAGDLVLITVAQSIQAMVRKYDLFVRLGGDEFVIILPDTDSIKAQIFVKRLERTLQSINVADISGVPTTIKISASVGKACYRAGQPLDQLIRAADQDMYRQKQRIKNCAPNPGQQLAMLNANVS